MIGNLPPATIFFAAALVLPFLSARLRALVLLAVPVVSIVTVLRLDDGLTRVDLLDYTLVLVRNDSLSHIFGLLFSAAAFVGAVYSLHVKKPVEQLAVLLYAGSALGVVYAGDLITLWIFWEMLALSSVPFIWCRGGDRAVRAGLRYAFQQLASGLLLLAGILIRIHDGDGIAFESMAFATPLTISDLFENNLSAALILLGFGLKCAFPLLHTWLVDGYPEGTVTGTVFMSGFTTKVAVYALARGFAGTDVLVTIGTVMALFPIFFAVIENDLRRVLSYSMVNQLGFMVIGIGIGSAYGINGAVAHAVADVFFKGLLFMSMGAVLLRTGTTKGSELGGLYKSMPWTASFSLVGAASISALPLFSGFVSKSLILAAVAEEHFDVTWFLLLFASAGVVEHAGIKIPFFGFFGHDSGRRVKEAPRNMLVAMGISATACIAIGCLPHYTLYPLLPEPWPGGVFYSPYDAFHVISQLQLLCFASLAVFVLMVMGLYPPELPRVNLDADWLWRRGTRPFVWLLANPVARLVGAFKRTVIETVPNSLSTLSSRDFSVPWPRRWQLELSLFAVILLLCTYLLYNFLFPG